MTTARDQILARVNAALAPLAERAPLPDWDSGLVQIRGATPAGDPWTLFAERMAAVNGTPLASIADLVGLLERNGWMRGYCDPVLWPEFEHAFPAAFTVSTDYDRARIDDYDFGITAAAGAVAETGTIVLSDNGTATRLAALAPWVHIAVIRRGQIHPDILAAIAAFPPDPNIIWVTGPSKTADIEGVLIEGVHGPGVQVALLLDPPA